MPKKIRNSIFAQVAKAGLVLLAIGAVLYATCGGADSSPAMMCIFMGAVLTAIGGFVTAVLLEGESWDNKQDDEEDEKE